MKNKIFLTIIAIMLSMPLFVLAEEYVFPADEPVATEEIDNNPSTEELLPPKAEEQPVLPYKQPISKKTLLKKFLLAMLAVGGSAFVLYYGLSLYNRFNNGAEIQTKTNERKTSLTAPSNIEDASKIFLEKTCWK